MIRLSLFILITFGTMYGQAQLDIRSYGARCDGSNDAAAVQSALNAVTAGGTVLVPCQATIGSPGIVLSGKSNVTIAGTTSGAGFRAAATTGLGPAGLGPVLFLIQGCTNCVVKDLLIDDNNLAVGGLGFGGCTGSTAQNVTIQNSAYFVGGAISATANNGNQYLNNTILSSGYAGLWIGNNGSPAQYEQNAIITGNTIKSAHATAIAFHGTGATISGNYASDTNPGAGIKVIPTPGSAAIVIQNNTLLRNAYQGIQLSGASGGTATIQVLNNVADGNADTGIYTGNDGWIGNVTIKGNTIRNSGAAGIQIYSGHNVVISNNDISNDSSVQPNGIYLRAQGGAGSTVQSVQIQSNTIHSQSQNGVVLESNGGAIDSVTISSNSIFSDGRYGVVIDEQGHTGTITNVAMSANCFASLGAGSLYDGRPSPLAVPASSQSCSAPGTQDTQAPTATISAPTSGQSLSGTVTLAANANDNVGIAGVQFQIDGANAGGEVTKSPYTLLWDTRTVANGSHSVFAVARDAAGNRTTALTVYFTVANTDTVAPTVQITGPASGATISRSVTVSATASDNIGVAGVRFTLDGAALGTERTATPYSLTWDTSTIANGSHTITAIARDNAGNTKSATASVTVANAAATTGQVIRVNAGGSAYTDPTGKVWSADFGSSSGQAFGVSAPISNTTMPALYQTTRWAAGPLLYTFTVPNGAYTVTLKFAELYFTVPGARVFDVSINGSPVLTSFDIVAQAGGAFRAVDRSLPVTVTNGQIAIRGLAQVNNPQFNAIEIVPGVAAARTSIRVNAGGGTYTEASGVVWSADNGSAIGQSYATGAAIANTSNPTLYQSLRWNAGPLTYTFSVPNGTYQVTLKYAELYFNSAGSRVFDVSINGAKVLHDFDVFAQAGGVNRAVDRSFSVPVTNGQITIQATGTKDYPQINGIEITN